MSVTKNIEFHIEETWIVRFVAHNADNSVLSLVGLVGSAVSFRVSKSDNMTGAIITKTIGAGVTITDAANGAGEVLITPADQVTATIVKKKTYRYELKITTAAFVSVQAIGDLKTLPSLFAA